MEITLSTWVRGDEPTADSVAGAEPPRFVERESPPLHQVIDMLDGAGVRSLVLRDDRPPADGPPVYRPVQILVAKDQRMDAVKLFDRLGWRYSWIRSGLLRLVPGTTYWWDRGPIIELLWGLPAAPFPSWALRRLTRELWRTASDSAPHATPDPDTLLVHLAVQACRPGRGHEADWVDFLAARPSADMARVEAIAQRCGVSRAVRRASIDAGRGGDRPGPGPIYDGIVDGVWRALAAATARARPQRLHRLLSGAPAYGDAAIACQLAGVRVSAGPGVFVPAPELELFVQAALGALRDAVRPTVVEVGTGCGAMAIAVAHARPDSQVHGAELSARAVRSADRNAERLKLGNVRFHAGSLLQPLPASLLGAVDLLAANLPYIPASKEMSIGSVPRSTIEGSASDGLGLLRELAHGARPLLRPGGRLQLQMLARQWETLAPELARLGYVPGPPLTSGAFAICSADWPGQGER